MFDEYFDSDDDNNRLFVDNTEALSLNEINKDDFNSQKPTSALCKKSKSTFFKNVGVESEISDSFFNVKSKLLDDMPKPFSENKVQISNSIDADQSRSFEAILKLAREKNAIEKKRREQVSISDVKPLQNPKNPQKEQFSSWVRKYEPKSFIDLISDDMLNRLVLKWLKLWDSIIFNKPLKNSYLKICEDGLMKNGSNKKRPFKSYFDQKMELLLTYDKASNLPVYKILLITGDPGIGKTMLARIIANHCGYDVMEINASDERTPENYKKLFYTTSSVSYTINNKKPLCMIFDEIDGSPAKSIDIMIDYVTKYDVSKSYSLRPIICICNNSFANGLFKLKKIAFTINFPSTDSGKVVKLLKNIISKETTNCQYSEAQLHSLVKTCNNDIRTAINHLQFYVLGEKTNNVRALLESESMKDCHLSLFELWQCTFNFNLFKLQKTTSMLPSHYISNIISCCSNYDKYTHGLFENYPSLLDITEKSRIYHNIADRNSACIDAFATHDVIQTYINVNQNYSLYSVKNFLLPYSLHINLCFTRNLKRIAYQYPSMYYKYTEMQRKLAYHALDMYKNMFANQKLIGDKDAMIVDAIFYIYMLLIPNIKNTNLYMLSKHEVEALENIKKIMNKLKIKLKSLKDNQLTSNDSDSNANKLTFEPDLASFCLFPKANECHNLTGDIFMFLKQYVEKPAACNGNNAINFDSLSKSTDSSKIRKDFFGRIIAKNNTDPSTLFQTLSLNNETTVGCEEKSDKIAYDFYYSYEAGSNTIIKRKTKFSEFL